MTKPTVLVVDDEADLRLVLRAILEPVARDPALSVVMLTGNRDLDLADRRRTAAPVEADSPGQLSSEERPSRRRAIP